MKEFHIPDGVDKNLLRKRINNLFFSSQKQSRPDECILCGKKEIGLCNSHSIPQMILKNIADQGSLYQANEIVEFELIDSKKGIKNAGTFHYICRDCDKKYFSNYENPDNIRNYPSDEMLAEIALKDSIFQLCRKGNEKSFFSNVQNETHLYENKDVIDHVLDLDIRDYTDEIYLYKQIIDENEQGGFYVLFWDLLPYKTPIAMQSAIALSQDYYGRRINNVFDTSESMRIQSMHLCVFPLEKESVVLAFYHKRDRKYSHLRHQLNSISKEEKLVYLNWLIFKYTDNYYLSTNMNISPEKREKLRTLSRDQNGFPFGIIDTETLFQGDRLIQADEIPNLLSSDYAL